MQSKELTKEEIKDCKDGEALAELITSEGWSIIKKWLEARMIHSWINPKGLSQKEWMWAELNLYHSAEVSREILNKIDSMISKAIYLRKKQRGELNESSDKFKDIWSNVLNKTFNTSINKSK
jgi:hypothetical protein